MRRRFQTNAVTALWVCLALVAPHGARATQYDPPWSEAFGSDWGSFDTKPSALNFANNFAGSGYTPWYTPNVSANTAMSSGYAGDDAIWITFGHAAPGFITYCTNESDPDCGSYLYANSVLGNCWAPNDCISDHPNSIRDMKLMVFAGCETAKDGNASALYDANLLDQAKYGSGVDSVVGFWQLVWWPQGHWWSRKFPQYLKADKTVSQSLYLAQQDLQTIYGPTSQGGWQSYHTRNGGLTVIPAGYGTP